MGPRKILFAFILLFIANQALALTPAPIPLPTESKPTAVPPEPLTPWTLMKQKFYPNYKVEIWQRMTMGKFPRVDSTKTRIIPTALGTVTEYLGTWTNPDPRVYGFGWKGGPLDLDGDGVEDLMLQNYSAGVHCCYNYVIYSLTIPLKKLGNLEMKDCGGQIRLEDLNSDKKMEIISCTAKFAYLGKLPFSDSPFPPAVYTLQEGRYHRADKEFKQIFLADIQAQRDNLARGYNPTSVLQIAADYFMMGDELQGWKEFDALYQGDDKETMRMELLKRLGKPAGPETQAAIPSPKPAVPTTPTYTTPTEPYKLP